MTKRTLQKQILLYKNTKSSILPREIWSLIYNYLTISELIVLSETYPWQYSYIAQQSIWEKIAGEANLGVPKRKYKTFYELVQSKATRICEYCYRMGKPSGHRAIIRIKIKERLNKNTAVIHLCLNCRKKANNDGRLVDTYDEIPIFYESYWNCDETQEYIEYASIKLYFSLRWNNLTEMPVIGKFFRIEPILRLAQIKYGGNAGIKAFQLAKNNRRKLPLKQLKSKRTTRSCLHDNLLPSRRCLAIHYQN